MTWAVDVEDAMRDPLEYVRFGGLTTEVSARLLEYERKGQSIVLSMLWTAIK